MNVINIDDKGTQTPVIELGSLLDKQQVILGNYERDLVLRTAGNIKIQVGGKFYDLPIDTSTDGNGGGSGKTLILNNLVGLTYPGDGYFIYTTDDNKLYITVGGVYELITGNGDGGNTSTDPLKIFLSYLETQQLNGIQKSTVLHNSGLLLRQLSEIVYYDPSTVYENQIIYAADKRRFYGLTNTANPSEYISWEPLFVNRSGDTMTGNLFIEAQVDKGDATNISLHVLSNSDRYGMGLSNDQFNGLFVGSKDKNSGLSIYDSEANASFVSSQDNTIKFLTNGKGDPFNPLTLKEDTVGVNGSVPNGYKFSVKGTTYLNGKTTVTDNIKSDDYVAGPTGAGFSMYQDQGKWTLEVDYLKVRNSSEFAGDVNDTKGLNGSLVLDFSLVIKDASLYETIDIYTRAIVSGKYSDTNGTVIPLANRGTRVNVIRTAISQLLDPNDGSVDPLPAAYGPLDLIYGIGDMNSSGTPISGTTYLKDENSIYKTIVGDTTYDSATNSFIPSNTGTLVSSGSINVYNIALNNKVAVGDLFYYKRWDKNKTVTDSTICLVEVVKTLADSFYVYAYNTILEEGIALVKIGNRYTDLPSMEINSGDQTPGYIQSFKGIKTFNQMITNYYVDDIGDGSDTLETDVLIIDPKIPINTVNNKWGSLDGYIDVPLGLNSTNNTPQALYSKNAFIEGNFVGHKMILGTELNYENGILRIKDLETIKSRNITGSEGLNGGGNLFLGDIVIKHNPKTWVDKTPLTGGNVISNLTIDAYGHPTNWSIRQLNGVDINTLVGDQSLDIGIAKYLRWRNYGNGHIIFDGSSGLSPAGTSISSNTNSQNIWIPTHPILMGWNGTQTYGVKVDMARQSDVWANAGSYVNTDVPVNTYMMGLGADGNWHPIGKVNITNFLGEVTPVINSIVKRDVNGYIEANFFKSTTSAQAPQTSTPSSLYGNAIGNDGFHYSYTKSAVSAFLGLGVLATNQADLTTIYDTAPTGNKILGMGTDGLVHVYSPTSIQTWLGLTPGNYVRKSPLSITAAGTADIQINNLVTFAYNTSGSQWTGALMSIGGFNGGNYDLQLNGDYSINELGFRNRNGDNNTWGSWKRVLYQGFTAPAVLLGGIGTSYQNATLQLQHTTTPPNLAFHFAGVVASQISIQTSGRIAIIDNPGTSYEALIAARITASNGFKSTSFQGMAGDYDTNTTANKIIWTIGDQWNTIPTMYGLGYSYNSSFRNTMHQVVVSLAGTQNISLGMDGRIIARDTITAGTGTEGGFQNIGYVAGHNNIWRLGNAVEYGIGYYQGGDSGNDSIGMHFSARATPQHRFYGAGNAVHTGSVTAGKTVIGASDEQVRMVGDNPFISWSRNTGVRIGYIQGTGSGNLAIQSETGPLSLGATGGVIVNSLLTVNANIATQNYIYSAVDGTTADVYGIISVTRGTASNLAYFGMTRAGQAGYSWGIDTGNRMIWGVGAGGGAMSTLAYLDLAGRFGTVSNISAGGTVTGAGIGVTQTAGTGQGISLYNGSGGNTVPTYGLLFGLTSSFGTHGSVTGDFATYFTLDGTANRGWVFRTIAGSGSNVASIGATGNMYLNGSMTAAGGGFNSHRHLKHLYDFKENFFSALSWINELSIRKFSYLNNMSNRSLGLIIDEIPQQLKEILLVDNNSVDLYSLHSLSLLAHKETKSEIEKLKNRITELEFKLKSYG